MKLNKIKFNWPLIGNRHITDFLERAISRGNLSGSYIFYGPENLGKATLACHFAKIILCTKQGNSLPCGNCLSCFNFQAEYSFEGEAGEEKIIHSDCRIIKKEKDKKNISIDQVRDFIRTLHMSSFLNNFKVGIIRDAESLSPEAANALLKTLEEPKEKTIIILIAKSLETIPSTIISRSQILNFYPVSADIIYDYLTKEKKINRGRAKSLARLALGRPALALKFLEEKEYYDLYLQKISVFLNFIGQDLNERFAGIESLLGAKARRSESILVAKKILECWQGIVRDWLLLEYGHINLIQNQVVEETLVKTQKRFSPVLLVDLLRSIRQAEEYIEANINPRSALEYVAINI